MGLFSETRKHILEYENQFSKGLELLAVQDIYWVLLELFPCLQFPVNEAAPYNSTFCAGFAL